MDPKENSPRTEPVELNEEALELASGGVRFAPVDPPDPDLIGLLAEPPEPDGSAHLEPPDPDGVIVAQ